MKEHLRWEDIEGKAGRILSGKASIAIEVFDHTGFACHRITTEDARTLAGALLQAAQHIDPLPDTKPNPTSTPDRLT